MPAPAISVQLYTLREQCAADFPATLRAVADAGYTAVELAGLHGMTPKGLRAVLDDLGLKVSGSHLGVEQLQSDAEQAFSECEILGSPYAILGWVSPEVYSAPSDWQRLADILAAKAREAEKHLVRLAYHNHDFELRPLADGPATPLEILSDAQVGQGYVFELDVYWAKFAGQDPVTWIRRLAGRVPILHMKDMAGDDSRAFAEVGEGILDWPAILTAAHESNVEWLVIEQDTCPRPPIDCVTNSLANLRRLLGQNAA